MVDPRRFIRGLYGRAAAARIRAPDIVIMHICGATGAPQSENGSKPLAPLRFFPTCSRDFNPGEKVFFGFHAMLRRAGERTVNGLVDLIGKFVGASSPMSAPTILAFAAMNRNERKPH